MKITEPYSPMARAKASAKPVSRAGTSGGSKTRTDRLQPCGAERGGGFLEFDFEFGDDRLHGAHDEGQADEDQGDENAPAREGDLDANSASGAPNQPFGA